MSDTRSHDITAASTHSHDWHAIRRFITFTFASIAILLVLFWVYYKVMIPILVGAFVAYFVAPWVDYLERRRINRGVATALIMFTVIGGLTFAVIQLGPLFYDQLRDLIHRVPTLLDSMFKSALAMTKSGLMEAGMRDTSSIDRALRNFNLAEQALPRLQMAMDGIWTTGASIMGSLISFILIPFLTFFFIFEKPRIFNFLRKLAPRDTRPYFKELFGALDTTLKAVVRGHIKVAATLAVFYSIGFSAIGLSAGVAIGLAAGACRVIPYLDALVGILLSVTYIFTAGMPPSKVFAVLGVVGLVQVLDGAIVTPKLIGGRVGLHPAVVILTVIAASYHLGFWGVLLAIPLAATVKTIFKMILPVYRDSAWFRDQRNQ